MALLGLSLIVASVVLFCMRRPAWLSSLVARAPPPAIEPPTQQAKGAAQPRDRRAAGTGSGESADDEDASSLPLPEIRHTDITTLNAGPSPSSLRPSEDDGQSTPKASASLPPGPVPPVPVPAFSLSPAPETPTITTSSNTDNDDNNVTETKPAPPPSPSTTQPSSASTLMPPPPRPPTLRPTPTSSSPSSTTAARNRPIPARGPGCSTLAPPPTHTSIPTPNGTRPSSSSRQPSRTVVLTPGHSPLDWARLTSSPTADLRGLPPGTPYLRVTPSMLRRMTGRRGKDAWTVLGGRVYNLTPYLPFHPGGEPELLRAAGRDGTRLFGEVHPWVNYEGMLAACLVGIYVPEEERAGSGEAKASPAEDMEAMD